MKLKDRIAIIFGGTSGLGEATAKAYANEGAKVVIVGRNESKGNHIINEIRKKVRNQFLLRQMCRKLKKCKEL